jgi:hypothetical protein
MIIIRSHPEFDGAVGFVLETFFKNAGFTGICIMNFEHLGMSVHFVYDINGPFWSLKGVPAARVEPITISIQIIPIGPGIIHGIQPELAITFIAGIANSQFIYFRGGIFKIKIWI